jgi:hypothetical protein
MEILQLPWSRRCPVVNTPNLNLQRYLLSLHCRAHLSTNCSFGTSELDWRLSTELLFIITSHEPNRKHRSQQYPYCLRACMLLALLSNGRCLQSHCSAPGLYAKLHSVVLFIIPIERSSFLWTLLIFHSEFRCGFVRPLIHWYLLKYECSVTVSDLILMHFLMISSLSWFIWGRCQQLTHYIA